jgi:hypothetical protein
MYGVQHGMVRCQGTIYTFPLTIGGSSLACRSYHIPTFQNPSPQSTPEYLRISLETAFCLDMRKPRVLLRCNAESKIFRDSNYKV